MLDELWQREVMRLRLQSIKSKDKKGKKLVAELGNIKDEVKDALLKNYLLRCSIRHALAFF